MSKTSIPPVRVYLIFAVVALLAYWPSALHIFSLKNDALVYFLPYRYHVSEAIQQGSFPFWSPYLYTGLPLHSDIQSGVWNPVVMIISLFTTYDMSVLQWELLFYLFAGGVGMYRFLHSSGHRQVTAIVAGIAYMCSGFMTDSSSIIPWITNAAWLPWVFHYFRLMLAQPGLTNSLKFSFFLSLLLTAGYPSYFIFSVYLMGAALICWFVVRGTRGRRVLIFLGLSAVVFLLICSPAILSWLDFLPYYDRGGGANLERSQLNPFTPFSTISYLLPSAVSRDHPWLQTDMSARNASVSLFIFLAFITSLFLRMNRRKYFLVAVLLFTYLFSLGNIALLREWCYNLLPGMNTFRHPASIRVFTGIAIILLAAPVLDAIFESDSKTRKRFIIASIAAGTFLLAMTIVNLFQASLSPHLGNSLKGMLDSLDFHDMVVLTGALQVIFLAAGVFILHRRKEKRLLPLLIIANAVIFCWIAQPFTMISQVKTSTVDAAIEKYPHGFPLPNARQSIGAEKFFNPPKDSFFLYANHYSREITIQDYVISPTIPRAYFRFLDDFSLRDSLKGTPFLALVPIDRDSSLQEPLSGKGSSNISIGYFSPNETRLTVNTANRARLIIFQQYHHNWKATIDRGPATIDSAFHAFMQIELPGGLHYVTLQYSPGKWIIAAMVLSPVVLFAIFLFLVYRKIRSRKSGGPIVN